MNIAHKIKEHQLKHPEIGTLSTTVYYYKGDAIFHFHLQTNSSFRFLRSQEPEGHKNTLNYQWYNRHLFQPNEQLQWQSKGKFQEFIGPWCLDFEKDRRSFHWEIPSFKLKRPTLISLYTNIEYEGRKGKIRLEIHNEESKTIDLRLKANFSPREDIQSFFSGSTQAQIKLKPHARETYIYEVEQEGEMQFKVHESEKLLQRTSVSIDFSSVKIQEEKNSPVAVQVYNAWNQKQIKRKRDYYKVSPEQEILVTINPKDKNYVPTVQDISISHHPNITIAETGRTDDKVFSYSMKFSGQGPLATKLRLLYSVKYQNAESRPQTLAFKLKPSPIGLILLGSLFILPSFLDTMVSTSDWWARILIVVLCILIPFAYDWINSY